jgi:hypothetical protein
MPSTKSKQIVRMKPRNIIGTKPATEIQRAQHQTAAFVYDLALEGGEDAEEAMKEVLDMLGIRACVDEECCP